MVVYGYLKKVFRKHSTSISGISAATEQSNAKITSAYSAEGDVSSNDVEKGTDTSSFRDATTNKFYKHEELMAIMMKKIDKISQRMDNSEKR